MYVALALIRSLLKSLVFPHSFFLVVLTLLNQIVCLVIIQSVKFAVVVFNMFFYWVQFLFSVS